MISKWKKRIAVAFLGTILLTEGVAECNTVYADYGKPSHGSSEIRITEDMLTNEIPADYKVNSKTQGKAKDGKYNSFFLKDSVQTISIEIDPNNLNYMFQNALYKPTVMAERVTIGDQSVSYVGLKTKGSYTLEYSYKDNKKSDRFSLTINFGKYVKKKEYGEKQNFFGVDKISLNNFFFDKSMMKEFCSLALMSQMGIPTPQFGLAKLYINGEYYGVYSMIESLDSSVLEQYYHCDGKEISDYLCKPEGTRFLYSELSKDNSPLWEEDEDTYKKVEKMLPTVEEWVRRLNCLSEGKDFDDNELDVNSDQYLELLEQVIDVDEYLRYFAAHSFLCQLDNMFVGQKNFGLYVDKNGKSLLIPWDYDLSFGCYSPVTAEATANYDLDLMFIPDWNESNLEAKKVRYYKKYPMFHVLFQNEKLMERYHTYMLDCTKIAALGGTTSFGKTFAPNYLNDQIKTLTDSLTEAATEKVSERAGYMNGIVQPKDLLPGLSNLAKIISMRSVGVYCQVQDIDTTVSGRGCNLLQVGNGQDNWWLADQGNITAVNVNSGFFSSAEYGGRTPLLTVTEILPEEERYEIITTAAEYSGRGYFKAYSMEDKAVAKVKGGYRLYLPLDKKIAQKQLQFFTYEDGALTELATTLQDNIFIADVDKLGILVIKEKKNPLLPLLYGGIAALAAVIAVMAVVVVRKKHRRRDEQQVCNE